MGQAETTLMPAKRQSEPNPIIVAGVCVAITIVWAIVATASILTKDFTALEIVSAPFVMMCGYLFGVKVIRGNA